MFCVLRLSEDHEHCTLERPDLGYHVYPECPCELPPASAVEIVSALEMFVTT